MYVNPQVGVHINAGILNLFAESDGSDSGESGLMADLVPIKRYWALLVFSNRQFRLKYSLASEKVVCAAVL